MILMKKVYKVYIIMDIFLPLFSAAELENKKIKPTAILSVIDSKF